MACIIRESLEDKFIKTKVHFDESHEALDNFFKTTKAFPGTTRWFVSDRMTALLKQGQLCGFRLREHCEEIPR